MAFGFGFLSACLYALTVLALSTSILFPMCAAFSATAKSCRNPLIPQPMKTYIVDDSHLSKCVTVSADDVDECLEKFADVFGLDFGSYRYDPQDDSASCRMVTCDQFRAPHWVYVKPGVLP